MFSVSLENNISNVIAERSIEYSGVVTLLDKMRILVEESERRSENSSNTAGVVRLVM